MGKRVKPMKELDHIFLREDDPDDIDALMRAVDARLSGLEKDRAEDMAKADGETGIQGRIKSCNQTDEFDLGYSHGECTEEEQKRIPFIVLKVPNSRNWPCVKGLEGKFAVDQQRGFIFHTRISLRATAHLPSTDGYSKPLLPLLQMLCAEGYAVRIVGESAGGYFYVKGIHMSDTEQKPSGPFVKCLQDRQLQVLLERLLHSEDMGGRHEETSAPSPVFTTKADLTALFQVCRHTYPPTIQEWAENIVNAINNCTCKFRE